MDKNKCNNALDEIINTNMFNANRCCYIIDSDFNNIYLPIVPTLHVMLTSLLIIRRRLSSISIYTYIWVVLHTVLHRHDGVSRDGRRRRRMCNHQWSRTRVDCTGKIRRKENKNRFYRLNKRRCEILKGFFPVFFSLLVPFLLVRLCRFHLPVKTRT